MTVTFSDADRAAIEAAGVSRAAVLTLVDAGASVPQALMILGSIVESHSGPEYTFDLVTQHALLLRGGLPPVAAVQLPCEMVSIALRAMTVSSWPRADTAQLITAMLGRRDVLSALADITTTCATLTDARALIEATSEEGLGEGLRMVAAGLPVADVAWVNRVLPDADIPMSVSLRRLAQVTDNAERRLALTLMVRFSPDADLALGVAAALPSGHLEATRLVLDDWPLTDALRAARALAAKEPRSVSAPRPDRRSGKARS